MKTISISLSLATLLVASSCSSDSSSKPNLAAAVQGQNLPTLFAALEAADLTATLQGAGDFTLLAPSEAAFAALPDGTLDFLLDPANKQDLVDILTYHVISGKIMSADIAGKTAEVATVQGSNISVNAMNGVMVDNATVVAADIEADNGVIHVIDQVVLPN